jgi:predicted dehydrogenase
MTDLTVAIVGCGIIADNHAAAIIRHPDLRVVALVDADKAACARLVSRVPVGQPAFFESMAAAFAALDIDLVVICTPSGLHTAQALEALEAGKHVVIEKPLDASLARARAFAAATVAGKQVCAVISQHRFDPASVAVKEADLGVLTSAVASVPWWRAQSYYDQAAWRGTWTLDGGGALMNQGVHTVDLLLWLLGEPVEVSAYTAKLAHEEIEVEDVAVAVIRFSSGALATLHATTAGHPGLGVRLAVHGTKGSAILEDDELVYLGTEVVAAGKKPDDAFVVGHYRQYVDIVEAITDHRAPGVRVEDALLAMAVVKAVYVSAHLHRPVEVAAVLAGQYDGIGENQ